MKLFSFMILLGLVSATQAQNINRGTTNLQFYEVKEGETEEDVAKKFGITVNDLKKWNNLDNPIEEGRVLSIDSRYIKKMETKPESKQPLPENKPERKPAIEEKVKNKPNPSGDSGYHIVLANETLYHIAHLYNITVQQLMDLNHLTSATIKEGQNLKVK